MASRSQQLGGRASAPQDGAAAAAGTLHLGSKFGGERAPPGHGRGGPKPDADGHVLEPLQPLERLDHGGHAWPVPGLRAGELHRQVRHRACAFDGVVPRQLRVHDAAEAAAAGEVGPGPLHKLDGLLGMRSCWGRAPWPSGPLGAPTGPLRSCRHQPLLLLVG